MSWFWQADIAAGADADGDDLVGAGLGTPFADQAAAEAWLTDNYEMLTDLGASEVSLFEEDRLVYGPMSLLPE